MTECAAQLRELSEPWVRGDKIKRAIERAAKRSGLPYWRAFDIWYGKARRILPQEAERVSTALTKKREEAARNELHELRVRLERLESLLVQSDPDFHRPSADYVRAQIRKIDGGRGFADRAVAPKERR